MSKPYILITNDDGVNAPGIKHLTRAVSHFADVIVVAPTIEQSGAGLSITIRQPLRLQKVVWSSTEKTEIWSVSGTPSDCIKLGLSIVTDKRPALILSGINQGSNAGRNYLYSGTVAAVIEAGLQNIPGIAFSMVQFENPRFEEAEQHILPIVKYLLEHPLPEGTFLNVNFPEGPIKGIKMARQGREYLAENPEGRSHPHGHTYYWLGFKAAKFKEEEDSDIALLEKGYATAVPLHIKEITDFLHMEQQKSIFESFVNPQTIFSHSPEEEALSCCNGTFSERKS